MPDGAPMTDAEPPLARMAAAFAAIYLVWGSTFLAIRFAVAEIPPFLMAGARFLAAGVILYLWRRLLHAERPGRGHWGGAALIGALLFLGGNGSVVWSIQRVPSGLVALMLATIPLWMVLLDAMGRGARPNGRVMAGVILGLAGLGILLGPSTLLGAGRVDLPGAAVLMAGSICWATGSLVSRRIRQPSSHALAAGMQMMIGGVILLLVSVAAGEMHRLEPGSVTSRAILALAYLIFFGSVISFTAYTWLLSVTTPARVSTYAFVNPVIAVLLGWTLAGEPLTPRTLIALVVIVTAVAMIIATNTVRAGARAR